MRKPPSLLPTRSTRESKWKKLHTTFIKIRNKLLLYLGFTLVNKHGHTVHLVKGQQIMSNPKRVKPYSLDDPSWRIQKG